MIKINKDLTIIPKSLIPAHQDLFPPVPKKTVVIPRVSKTTHAKRLEIFLAAKYINTHAFNSRYKLDDIKKALSDIYKNKCAFCEQKIEQSHVEHYRPKTTYYWLAFSWDNLLMACPTCNQNKATNFAIDGPQAVFNPTTTDIRTINNISSGYDSTELPRLINPEITDPSSKISFLKNGVIESDNLRFKYTIEICKIDRNALNDRRRAILDRFREAIISALVENSTVEEQVVAIRTNVLNFKNDASNLGEEFLAFRNHAIKNKWLADITKELI